jgi:hypothetical protein
MRAVKPVITGFVALQRAEKPGKNAGGIAPA